MMYQKDIRRVLDNLISTGAIVGFEKDPSSGFFFLQTHRNGPFDIPVELLFDVTSSEDNFAIIGRGCQPFPLTNSKISALAFIAANSLNKYLAEGLLSGQWMVNMEADLEDIHNANGKGGFMFCCIIPSTLSVGAVTTCVTSAIDAFDRTYAYTNHFIMRAIYSPDEIDTEDALFDYYKTEDVFIRINQDLEELLVQYSDDEMLPIENTFDQEWSLK